MTLTVDVISDVICPWCYIGKRRLEKAVAAFGREQVRVRWHPFQLNPQMPKGGMNRKEYRTAKFGSWERSLALDAQVAEAGRAEGIPFAFDKIMRTPEHPRRPPPDRTRRHGGRAGRRGGGDLPGLLRRGPGHQPNNRPSRRGGRGRAGPGPGRGDPERQRGTWRRSGRRKNRLVAPGCRACRSSSSTTPSLCPGRENRVPSSTPLSRPGLSDRQR